MNVNLYESNTHVFIIKLWADEVTDEPGQVVWRGHITHVPSQRRQYIEDLFDIPAFILLAAKDVRFKGLRRRRLQRWIARWLPW